MHIDYEIIAPVIGLFVTLIGVIVALSRALGKSGTTNSAISESMIKQTETLIKFNNELQEQSAERRTWQRESAELRAVTSDLSTQVRDMQTDCAERETNMIAEIESLKTKITLLEDEIKRLQSELMREQDMRRRDLKSFDEQLRQKDDKIEALKTERAKLIARLTALETAMNGKQDKPDTGALSAIKAQPVTGAMSNQTTEDTTEEKTTNEG